MAAALCAAQNLAGNVAECGTLEVILKGLNAPQGALVIMDRGIATEANVGWLIEHGYRYLVVSRDRVRKFDETQGISIETAGVILCASRKRSARTAKKFVYIVTPWAARRKKAPWSSALPRALRPG